MKALGLKGTEVVVDLGAGPGYFTFRLAKALPNGRVVAIDSQPEMARHIHRKVLSEGLRNIQAQVAKSEDDPGLPAGADLVLVCDVLMHVKTAHTIYKPVESGTERAFPVFLITAIR